MLLCHSAEGSLATAEIWAAEEKYDGTQPCSRSCAESLNMKWSTGWRSAPVRQAAAALPALLLL